MGLNGTWYNELGSKMTLEEGQGDITGTYQTAVGDVEGIYGLVGQVDISPYSFSQAVSWTVVWNNQYKNSHSTTAWAGQYQLNEETGEEEVYTFWLLVNETESENDWQATQIGQDTFSRNPPDEETIKRARRRAGCSEPTKQ